jgi:hypothetical protein
VSAVPKVTARDIDQRIERVRSVLDLTAARLVELDADVTRQLLETSTTLEGSTAERWADATRRHADLWRCELALEAAVGEIALARGERRILTQSALHRLAGALDGACVELPRPAVDGSRPRLTQVTEPTVALTMDEALEQMSGDYEVVAGVVASVAEVWGPLTDRLHGLRTQLDELDAASEAPGGLPNERRSLGEAIDHQLAWALVDPLGLPLDSVALLENRLGQLRTAARDAARDRAIRLAALAEAEQAVTSGLEAVTAGRRQLEQWREKVVVPPTLLAELGRQAEELERVREGCVDARSAGSMADVDGLRRRSARRGCDAADAPVDRRHRALQARSAARAARRLPGQGGRARPGGGPRARRLLPRSTGPSLRGPL